MIQVWFLHVSILFSASVRQKFRGPSLVRSIPMDSSETGCLSFNPGLGV